MSESELEDRSMEDLEKMMEDPSLIDAAPPEEPSVESTEVPAEPAPVEPEQPTETDSPEDQVTPEVETAAPTEQPPEAEAAESEVVEVPLDEQIHKNLIEEHEARAKHFESVAGKNAGKLGHVEQQLSEVRELLAAQAAASAQPDPNGEYPVPSEPRPEPVPQIPRADPIASWTMGESIKSAANQFFAEHGDISDHSTVMAEYLKQHNYNAQALLESFDPSYAARETSRALEEAYWHSKSQHHAAVREQLQTKKAEQFTQLKAAKLSGGPTQSGATPAPKPVAKSLEDMTESELLKELERLS